MIVEPDKTRIGWIGLGVMGRSMCGHLIDRGFAATVYTRTPETADSVLAKGAEWADGPKTVAEQSDVVFTIVGFPSDVREVVLGPDGALAGCEAGDVLVDMTTSEPSLAVEIYEAARAKGVASVDAPVSGGDVGAQEARLSIMIGGDEEVVEALGPCWDAMGECHRPPRRAGRRSAHEDGQPDADRLGNDRRVRGPSVRLQARGLDLDTVMRSVASGAAGSWSLSNLGTRMIANNFDPGFFVEHFVKDMGIALAEASRMKLALPGLALAHQLYTACAGPGEGEGRAHKRAPSRDGEPL